MRDQIMSKFEATDDNLIFWVMGTIFFPLVCFAASLSAWNSGTASPLMTFLGYGHWFFATDPEPIKRYLLSRPWHIVPLISLSVSFLLILKTLITGKCAFLKGMSLGLIVGLNLLITVIFITPMCVETIIIIGLVIGFVFLVVVSFVFIGVTIENRFNRACNCGVEKKSPPLADRNINISDIKDMETAFYSSLKGEENTSEIDTRSPIKTAKITSPYVTQKKYPQGR